MGRVAVGVEEADGEGLDPGADEVGDFAAGLLLIERHDDAPVAVQTLVDLPAEGPRDERLREAQEQVVDVVTLFRAHLEDVTEPTGRQETERTSVPLDDGVGHQGRAVNDSAEVCEAEPGRPDELLEALQGARRRVLGRREALVEPDSSGLSVDEDEVREGPADVHAHAVAVVSPSHRWLSSRPGRTGALIDPRRRGRRGARPRAG